jgi:hypothetical protein
MGFGAGSALTIIPIAIMIQSRGYELTFLYFGLGQGIIVVLLSLFLAAPPPGHRERVMRDVPASVQSTRHQYAPREMLRTSVFGRRLPPMSIRSRNSARPGSPSSRCRRGSISSRKFLRAPPVSCSASVSQQDSGLCEFSQGNSRLSLKGSRGGAGEGLERVGGSIVGRLAPIITRVARKNDQVLAYWTETINYLKPPSVL